MPVTAAFLLVAGLIVGITDQMPTNGFVRVRSEYVEAVRKAGHTPVVICRAESGESLDRLLTTLDVLMLTGGEDVDPSRYGELPSPNLGGVNVERDKFEHDLLTAAVRCKLPVVGICRGMQHLNVFFGGSLYQDLPSGLPEYTIEHRAVAATSVTDLDTHHWISVVEGSRLANVLGRGSRFSVNSRHHQAVRRVAPGFVVTARSDDGIIEAIESMSYPAAGVQFHPERMSAFENINEAENFFRCLSDFVGSHLDSRNAKESNVR